MVRKCGVGIVMDRRVVPTGFFVAVEERLAMNAPSMVRIYNTHVLQSHRSHFGF
jgi:hypothetical protein